MESLALKEKSKIYDFLANIFAKEPRAELLEFLQNSEDISAFQLDDIGFFYDLKGLSLKEQEETLAVEYANLFLVPGTKASPHESIQRGEARLWGDSTVAVRNIYKKFGFGLDSSFRDTPDHLSVELSFLGQLTKLELEYQDKGLLDSKKGVLEVKKYFLKNHILKWYSKLKTEINEKAKFNYYKVFVKFTSVLLNDDLNILSQVEDIVVE